MAGLLMERAEVFATTEARAAIRAAKVAFRAALAHGRRSPATVAAFRSLRFARGLRTIALDWYYDELDAAYNAPERVAARAAEYRATVAANRAQSARRKARQSMDRRAKELGRCPRCVNGYIPNMPVDGGVCYRCNGTGNA